MLLAILNYLLALAAIGIAFTFGGKPERLAGVVVLSMTIIIVLSMLFGFRLYSSVDPVALFDDLVGLLGFSYIGISSKRIWPLWAASLQLLSVGAHFVRALEIPVRPIVYFWMKSGPTWAVLVLVIIGTLANIRQKRDRESAHYSPN